MKVIADIHFPGQNKILLDFLAHTKSRNFFTHWKMLMALLCLLLLSSAFFYFHHKFINYGINQGPLVLVLESSNVLFVLHSRFYVRQLADMFCEEHLSQERLRLFFRSYLLSTLMNQRRNLVQQCSKSWARLPLNDLEFISCCSRSLVLLAAAAINRNRLALINGFLF